MCYNHEVYRPHYSPEYLWHALPKKYQKSWIQYVFLFFNHLIGSGKIVLSLISKILWAIIIMCPAKNIQLITYMRKKLVFEIFILDQLNPIYIQNYFFKRCTFTSSLLICYFYWLTFLCILNPQCIQSHDTPLACRQ